MQIIYDTVIELNENTDFIRRLDYQTTMAMLHMLMARHEGVDNNLSNKELEQFNYLKDWYRNNHNEV
jgi:hypothetical protein